MPRPKKPRHVWEDPQFKTFQPRNHPDSEDIILSVEGFEAIRLSDYEKLDQETAAKAMDVSRQTYGRILSEARGIVSEALVTGKTIIITGGDYKTRSNGRGRRGGRGRGRGRRF